ncbi:MAG: Flp family type IVb pilin [Betaproteobacteria bacterium]|jgi:pilus assembly protein Flp/PilA|nr:Flp family type IVb pilin [Betaproteobacteria bacterium]
MNTLIGLVRQGAIEFARDEEGAQVVEYALIIAVVSIAIVAALRGVVTDGSFTGFIARIKTCLTGKECV